MYKVLPVFCEHLLRIAEKLEKKLPPEDYAASRIRRFLVAADCYPELPSFFSSELRQVYNVLRRGLADDAPAHMVAQAAEGNAESRLANLRRDLQELRIFCAYVHQPIALARGQWAAVDDQQEYSVSLGLRRNLKSVRKHDVAGAQDALVETEHRQLIETLAQARVTRDMLMHQVLQRVGFEICTSLETFVEQVPVLKRLG